MWPGIATPTLWARTAGICLVFGAVTVYVGLRAGLTVSASIPIADCDAMFREGSWNDQAALRKLLNDPDKKHYRIWEGRV